MVVIRMEKILYSLVLILCLMPTGLCVTLNQSEVNTWQEIYYRGAHEGITLGRAAENAVSTGNMKNTI